MDYKHAFDLDGVLAKQPPKNPLPWRKMNGSRRREHLDWLINWYRRAPPLFSPIEQQFAVITARKCTPEVKQATEDWLKKVFPDTDWVLFMLTKPRNIDNVVAFKTDTLRIIGAQDYTEDNRKVVNALRLTCPNVRIWHFKNGKQILDYSHKL